MIPPENYIPEKVQLLASSWAFSSTKNIAIIACLMLEYNQCLETEYHLYRLYSFSVQKLPPTCPK